MASVHRSKIDAWLIAMLAGAMALVVLVFAATIDRAATPLVLWSLLPGACVGLGLPAWILLSTRYTIDPPELRIRCGPFRWRIPIAEITALAATRNPLSSPALSLDRIRISYSAGRSLMISPQDADRFVHELESARSALTHGANKH
ncbi:MAG: PH domain-containing protein [Dokdonella sp.]|nr:PH domain-containing protein [Dokdonella sp.]MCB1569573.1 PH domain-containing protein [Xanthomonadales bacterium]MCB1572362.1 PH domain-containing protein [Xanthomonadales bacterium]MCB1576256.1 PH domain-containing protein [Xanthomonadales bacterium]